VKKRTRTPWVLLAAAAAIVPSALVATQASPAKAAATVSGSFAFLNYNVAGLPVVHEPPTTLSMEAAANAIGSRLGPYDIVQMQEDFNYHAYIYATDTHPYRTATSGAAGIGDGLNTVSNDPFEDFIRVTWSSCYPDNGDCLTPKGFSAMRVLLAPGVYVDFINLHTNAGTSSGDETARENEWAQLTSWIAANVPAGDALIVAGDTNSRYTRRADDLQSFAANNGLTDAWVQLEMGGVAPAAGAADLVCNEAAITNTCEITNKFLYRSSKWVTLNATGYNNEHAKFLDSSGLMLSDMDPILTDVSWTENTSYQASDDFGGTGGTAFNDITAIPASTGVSALTLSSGSRVDNIGLKLPNGTTFTHGGTGGTAASLTLASGEYPVSLSVCEGSYNGGMRLFYAKWTTSLAHTLAGGVATSDCTTYTAPAGYQISGFFGRSGTEVDKIGVFYTKVP
jgi:Jacalin-like lectin domain/Endonuclease/Exonuclease/phosphatase family 2